MEVIEQHLNRPDVVFFIDPPYTAGSGKRAGHRLYEHSELDHERLFELAEAIEGRFLMTYENNEDIRTMAASHGFLSCSVAMKSAHHTKMTELLIWQDRRDLQRAGEA
jgi:DNA adenine methylase